MCRFIPALSVPPQVIQEDGGYFVWTPNLSPKLREANVRWELFVPEARVFVCYAVGHSESPRSAPGLFARNSGEPKSGLCTKFRAAAVHEARMKSYLGRSRKDTLDWLLNIWTKQGPPICFLDGFPGVGKTDLAIELLNSIERRGGWDHAVIDEISEGSSSVVDALMELSSRLSGQGLPEMETVLWTETRPLPGHAFEKALQRPVVIVIDQAQRLFLQNRGAPVPEMAALLSYMRNRPALKGRLLLLSDRLVEYAQWSEWIPRRTLKELSPDEAIKMFGARLEESGVSVEISLERKMQAVSTLNYNPRAIEALVGQLRSHTLDEVMAERPDLWTPDYHKIDPGFLKNLERDLLKATMNDLSPLNQRKLWRLSVYRNSFLGDAVNRIGGTPEEGKQFYELLITQFFLNFSKGTATLNPIVREIALSYLRDQPADYRQAHSAAADYYMRHFTAKNLVGSLGSLAARFAELRFHLVQAAREQELSAISLRLTDHLKSQIRAETPVPTDRVELDYRIGALGSLLGDGGAKGLEYHLARCLMSRNGAGDLRKAIKHAERALSGGRQEAPWTLLAILKRRADGPDAAVAVVQRALRSFSDHVQAAGPLYRLGADILSENNQVEKAIDLLDEGIRNVPPENNCFYLYGMKAELLCRCNKARAAAALLAEGFEKLDGKPGQERIRMWAILLCAAFETNTEFEDLLADMAQGRAYSPSAALGRILLYELSGDWPLAASTAKNARRSFPSEISLAVHEALCRLAAGDNEGALRALTTFPNFTLDEGAITGWLEAFIHLRRGQPDEAERALEVYLKRPLNGLFELEESFLLRLWDEQENNPNGNHLCFNLPILPPSLTNLDGPVRRLQFSQPCLQSRRVVIPPRRSTAMHPSAPTIYVSYAWGEDKSPDGRAREEFVERLCQAVRASGREIYRDKDRSTVGGSIDQFAKDLSRASRIVAVLSQRFLESEFCMPRELFRAYRQCNYDGNEFRERVVGIIMDDASPFFKDYSTILNKWRSKVEKKQRELSDADPGRVNLEVWRLMQLEEEMLTRLPGMLEALRDTIMLCDLDQIVANDFRDLLQRLP